MSFSLVSEIFTDEEMMNGTAEAWLRLQDPENVCSVLQTPHGTATVLITIVYGKGIGIGEAYNSTLSAVKTIEQAPVDQQVLDELLLNAVTATGPSTAVYTLDKGRFVLSVLATGVTSGFTIALQGSPDGVNWGECRLIANTGGAINAATITGNGTYIYEVVGTPKFVRANVTARTDGTISAWLQGGVI